MPIDPNIVYLILLIGLWLSVTAAYMPGTGIVEVLAFVGIVGALVALANMPTNWWSMIVIVVGVLGFLIVPFIDRRFAIFALGGLVLQAAGSFTLFDGVSVSLPLIAITVGAALLYHRFVLMPILNHHNGVPAMLDDVPMTGTYGYVQRALDPVGTVYVRGETWTARSDHKLDAGTEITVIDQEGLTLFVEPVKHKHHQEEV